MAMLESGEDYLETIYILKKKNGVVYSIDVARELGFTRPSVSRAMSILREEEYITMDERRSTLPKKAARKPLKYTTGTRLSPPSCRRRQEYRRRSPNRMHAVSSISSAPPRSEESKIT